MSTLRDRAIKLVRDNPGLLQNAPVSVLGKEAAGDPHVSARALVEGQQVFFRMLDKHLSDLRKGFQEGEKQLKGLDRFGSGTIEAPAVLKANIYDKLENLAQFTQLAMDNAKSVLNQTNQRVAVVRADTAPADVKAFLEKIEASFRRYFKNGFFVARASEGLGDKGIYIALALLPKGAQSNGIIENDPSYNTFWMHTSYTDEGLRPKIKLKMSQGNRLWGPNASNMEKVGWRDGTGKPDAILRKFDKYFAKLRAMVDAREDLPPIS